MPCRVLSNSVSIPSLRLVDLRTRKPCSFPRMLFPPQPTCISSRRRAAVISPIQVHLCQHCPHSTFLCPKHATASPRPEAMSQLPDLNPKNDSLFFSDGIVQPFGSFAFLLLLFLFLDILIRSLDFRESTSSSPAIFEAPYFFIPGRRTRAISVSTSRAIDPIAEPFKRPPPLRCFFFL